MHIGFNRPPLVGSEKDYLAQAMQGNKLSGDALFGKKCQLWFEHELACNKALLTPSCTAALEMAAMLIDIQPGDEVIMPSYTFVSTANAFVLRGAKVAFVDIRPDTMNIDEKLIEAAINERTKAIVPVHYAGIACNMSAINAIAEKYGLYVIEDAAQGMMSTYNGKPLGTLGHLSAYSFHETKNYTSGGEGGLLIINDAQFTEKAEIIREKGTNRSLFFRGMVDKYSWVNVGSSYLPSELQAAFLFAQLEQVEVINNARLSLWNNYHSSFANLQDKGNIDLPFVPKDCIHNAHMYYLKLSNIDERSRFIEYLKKEDITAVFHYIPLHSSPAGQQHGYFYGEDNFTTAESERLVRLPIYYGMTVDEQKKVIDVVESFFV